MADCCDCNELHANRAGLGIRINFKQCVDGKTVLRPLIAGDVVVIYVKKDNSTATAKPLAGTIESLEGGVASAVTLADTLDSVGIWKAWAEITRGGVDYPSMADKFMVFEN